VLNLVNFRDKGIQLAAAYSTHAHILYTMQWNQKVWGVQQTHCWNYWAMIPFTLKHVFHA